MIIEGFNRVLINMAPTCLSLHIPIARRCIPSAAYLQVHARLQRQIAHPRGRDDGSWGIIQVSGAASLVAIAPETPQCTDVTYIPTDGRTTPDIACCADTRFGLTRLMRCAVNAED
jgi:hypothetical protein